jgi:transcriptional regulator with XRE-family HTH domain
MKERDKNMEAFARKVREARKNKEYSQDELGKQIGVSGRSIQAYEYGKSVPRKKALRKLAMALDVSYEYLVNDEIDDPNYGKDMDHLVAEASSRFGSKGANEVEDLLKRNVALFAGGTISEEGKEAFFEALAKAYFACKEEARKTYGKKKSDSDEG